MRILTPALLPLLAACPVASPTPAAIPKQTTYEHSDGWMDLSTAGWLTVSGEVLTYTESECDDPLLIVDPCRQEYENQARRDGVLTAISFDNEVVAFVMSDCSVRPGYGVDLKTASLFIDAWLDRPVLCRAIRRLKKAKAQDPRGQK